MSTRRYLVHHALQAILEWSTFFVDWLTCLGKVRDFLTIDECKFPNSIVSKLANIRTCLSFRHNRVGRQSYWVMNSRNGMPTPFSDFQVSEKKVMFPSVLSLGVHPCSLLVFIFPKRNHSLTGLISTSTRTRYGTKDEGTQNVSVNLNRLPVVVNWPTGHCWNEIDPQEKENVFWRYPHLQESNFWSDNTNATQKHFRRTVLISQYNTSGPHKHTKKEMCHRCCGSPQSNFVDSPHTPSRNALCSWLWVGSATNISKTSKTATQFTIRTELWPKLLYQAQRTEKMGSQQPVTPDGKKCFTKINYQSQQLFFAQRVSLPRPLYPTLDLREWRNQNWRQNSSSIHTENCTIYFTWLSAASGCSLNWQHCLIQQTK